ncbi:MAG: hypothetical protein AAF361_11270 [Bacteroidota bacterium]
MNYISLQLISLLTLIILLCAACADDDNPPSTPYTPPGAIESKFREYVDRFVEEGASRGMDIDISDLTVVEGIAPENQEFCGYGYSNYNGTGRPRVEINEADLCWDDRSDVEKEILMFHELGHAVLGRFHKETRFPSTLPTSMMCSDACAGNNLFFVYNNYSPKLREYYLDELFEPFATPPEWVGKSDTTQFFTDNFEGDNSEWVFQAVNDDQGIFTSNRYDTTMTNDIALSITSEGGLGLESFAYWLTQFDTPDIPESAVVKVTATLDLDQVTGEGVNLVVRTDAVNGSNFEISGFNTTQGAITVNGTQQDRSLSVIMPYFPTDVDRMNVFFIIGGESSGKVYCKDIKVEVME